jgi:hypothetical protein
MDPNIPKWVVSSVAEFLKQEAAVVGLPFFAEGLDDPESPVYKADNLSFRIDGPSFREGSGTTIYRFELQALLTEVGLHNRLKLHTNAGAVCEALNNPIPIYNYSEDPPVFIGCFAPDPRSTEPVRIVNLGVVSVSSKVRQIAVVGKYFLEL